MNTVRMLLLSQDHKQVMWETNLPHMEVLRHPPKDWESIKDIPSLLGMDVISQLRLVIDKNVPEAYIESFSRVYGGKLGCRVQALCLLRL